ncbi:MAG: N-acetyl sugar amidotransferase [Microbacterium sp.]
MTGETRPYQRCTRTIMDTTDPGIVFDADGVCNYARNYDEYMGKVVDRALSGAAEPELAALVAKIKRSGKGKPYDCIIGVSGGVDSTYLLMRAVDLGLRPLAVHFDSGWNSELAAGNIQNLIEATGVDLYTHVVDWREMKDLQLSFFKASVANCDIPTDHAFGWVAFNQAKKYGIKYILSGSNYASESILPAAWGYTSDDARHLKAIQRRFGSVKLKTYPIMGRFRRLIWYPFIRGIKTERPLNLMPYVYKDAKAAIAERVGWRDYGGKHYESVFTRYFQGYYLPHKFGFDKRLAHYSSLIVSRQLTRDDALSLMETENYPDELRRQDHEFIAKKLGVSTEELEATFALAPKDYTDYPNSEKSWNLFISVLRVPVNILKALGLKKAA